MYNCAQLCSGLHTKETDFKMDLKMFVLVLLVCGVFGNEEEGLTWGDALVDDVSEFR